MRNLPVLFIALLLAVPAGAQQGAGQHAQHGGDLPEGWHVRVDGDKPADNVSFSGMGRGYHATVGPAAVFYNPAWSKSGDYGVLARFIQTKAPRHPEAYGIVIGGTALDGEEQAYSYFLVRRTGEYFIATRNGDERVKVVDWTRHPAVAKQNAAGMQSNVLGVEVQGDQVIFTVNGTEVERRPKSELHTDGVFGFRINHNLDVHIDPLLR